MRSTVTIEAAASLSTAVNVGGPEPRSSIVAIVVPADWDTADLTFQAAENATGDFYDVRSASGEFVVTAVAAESWVALHPADFAGIRYLKIRSGTSGTPVAQTNEIELAIIRREVA